VVRKTLYALLALGPLVIVVDQVGASEVMLFVLAALALIPLAWLIGEATEHAAHHTESAVSSTPPSATRPS
jgi:Ca2+:H+ antiporter